MMNLLNKIKKIQFSSFSFPLVVIILFVVCFGFFINQFSFFWDDWVQLLNKQLFGYQSYMAYFNERPLSGWTHIVFGPLMGDSNIRWEIFTLSLRFASVLVAWGLFREIWPSAKRTATLAALLFAVYPGFTQQPISVAYHQHWLQYLLFLISLWLMVLSIRQPKFHILFLMIALICQALQLSITEFFVGVECLRPVILWIGLNNPAVRPSQNTTSRQKFLKALLAWLPYLVIFLIYVIWRGFFMPLSATNQNAPTLLNSLAAQPIQGLTALTSFLVIDSMNILLVVWGNVLDLRLTDVSQPVIFTSWILSLLVSLGLYFYWSRLKKQPDEPDISPINTSIEMVFLGICGVILGPLPLWLANKNILWAINEDVYHADRFTLAAMLWASLLFIGLIDWLVDRWMAKAFFVTVMVGLLVGFQFRNANDYRWLASQQKDFYWQLSWRAPSIQPGTALISEEIIFPYQGLFSTASAVNLLYPQAKNPDLLAYWMYAINPRFSNPDLDVKSVSFDTHQRLTHFVGNTPNSLLIVYGAEKSNCLWVLRPEDQGYPDLSPTLDRWLPVSNLERISSKQASQQGPSTDLFGKEPAHEWCYFFEKADLARQMSDWSGIVSLGDQALQKGYSPDQSGSNSLYEWMPFIEAYMHLDHWSEASALILKSLDFDPQYAAFACTRWQALSAGLPAGQAHDEADRLINQTVRCGW